MLSRSTTRKATHKISKYYDYDGSFHVVRNIFQYQSNSKKAPRKQKTNKQTQKVCTEISKQIKTVKFYSHFKIILKTFRVTEIFQSFLVKPRFEHFLKIFDCKIAIPCSGL